MGWILFALKACYYILWLVTIVTTALILGFCDAIHRRLLSLWSTIKRGKNIVLGALFTILLALNLIQYVQGRVRVTAMQHTCDSLSLSNDTLRRCSLYDFGYRDGLLHGNATRK